MFVRTHNKSCVRLYTWDARITRRTTNVCPLSSSRRINNCVLSMKRPFRRVRRRTFHEFNSLNLVRLIIKSLTFGLILKRFSNAYKGNHKGHSRDSGTSVTRTQVSGFELSGRLIMHSDEPACPIIRESRLSFIKENEFSSSPFWSEFKLTESGAYPPFRLP